MVSGYNNTIHSIVKMRPKDVTEDEKLMIMWIFSYRELVINLKFHCVDIKVQRDLLQWKKSDYDW